jgi:membrane protein YqaA with SNARE-associated domain
MLVHAVEWLLVTLAIPSVGLGSIFVISLISATLLPLGSEPAVFAVIKANEDLFWHAILVGTLGNTIGGGIDYWLGLGAKQFFAKEGETVWFGWLQRFGARALLLSWLPVIGDPLCALAGWLRLPFWPCVFYMAIGKFLRYLAMTGMLLQVPDGIWKSLGSLF